MNTHTIEIAEEARLNGTVSSKRVSENRVYRACIVATTTEAVVEYKRGQWKELEAKLARTEVDLDAVLKASGLTFEQAKARYAELHAAMMADKDFYLKQAEVNRQVLLRERTGEFKSEEARIAAAKQAYLDAGCLAPYLDSSYKVVSLTESVVALRKLVAKGFQAPVIGSQSVLTWCGSVELAKKAIRSKNILSFVERGYRCQVRTDIKLVQK